MKGNSHGRQSVLKPVFIFNTDLVLLFIVLRSVDWILLKNAKDLPPETS